MAAKLAIEMVATSAGLTGKQWVELKACATVSSTAASLALVLVVLLAA
jgi:hypothetical protein